MKDNKVVGLRQPLVFFKAVVKDHKLWLILSIILVVIASTLSAASSYLFKLIIDAVETDNIDKALWFGLAFPVVIFAIQILYRASGVAAGLLILKVVKTATDTVHEYLLSHDYTYFSNRFAGAITNKVKNITNALDQVIPDFLWGQLDTLVTFLVTFALIFTVDTYAASIFILLIIALGLANKKMAKVKSELSKINAAASTVLSGRAVDVVGNMAAVRQFTHERFEQVELEKATQFKLETGLASWFFTEKMLLINSVIIFLFAFLMFWLLVTKWGSGAISTSDFILVVALISRVTGTLLFIGRAVNTTARAVGELREGLEDVYIEYEIADKMGSQQLTVTAGDIVWDKVTFKYEDNVIFKDFSLQIPGQQRIGLVGPSGAGKSTFVSLLLRQHELSQGAIMIDGCDISHATQSSLRAAIAIVPQEPALFHRSIKENIAYGKLDATTEEIERVAKLAHAHEFIAKLKEGYETVVGERGVKLSGGQRQRIAIARAMLKNAPILILDEATSALDSESEQLIQNALQTLMVGKTVIAIAHRLSTLKEMDRIIVINEGVIVEDGKHETLKNSGGIYERLWSHQSGGFLVD